MFSKIFVFCLISVTVKAIRVFDYNSTEISHPEDLLSKIFSGNLTQTRALHGSIKFENDNHSNYVLFDGQTAIQDDKNPVTFVKETYTNTLQSIREDDSNESVDLLPINNPSTGQKKRRRRRKPKNQFSGQPGLNPGFPVPAGQRPGSIVDFGPNNFQPGYNGPSYMPLRRPQSSLATDALAAVTGALTSVAQNDDHQCVARLLCEAAAGGALGGSSLLDSVSGLQPLLTLLSAYHGISSNPLFVFGRAAVLGVSSKGNSGSCRYAYPLCPTDPEELVHYLNNHNGGFFRFFNSPQHGQQNLEQFYNQLSQNYGLYNPDPEHFQGAGAHYGFLNPDQTSNYVGQHPNLYSNGYQQNYGLAFPHNQNYYNGNGIRFKNGKEIGDVNNNNIDNKIEKRILNKPENFLNDISNEYNSKWLFPGEDNNDNEENTVGIQYINYDDFKATNKRNIKTLRFPDDTNSVNNVLHLIENPKDIQHISYEYQNRKPKGISFPEDHNFNNGYNNNPYSSYSNYNNDIGFVFTNKQSSVSHYRNDEDELGVTTVYVVRGNGDPTKPEIVKLRAGETI